MQKKMQSPRWETMCKRSHPGYTPSHISLLNPPARPPAAYSERLLVCCPSMATISSPGRMPARSAGPPGAGAITPRALEEPCWELKDTSTPTPVTSPWVLRLRVGSQPGQMRQQ